MMKRPDPSPGKACITCGLEIEMDAKFCMYCGKEVTSAASEPRPDVIDHVACGNCGKVIPGGSRFCTYCGAVLDLKPVDVEVTHADISSCSSCGTAFDRPDVHFCPECGEKVPAEYEVTRIQGDAGPLEIAIGNETISTGARGPAVRRGHETGHGTSQPARPANPASPSKDKLVTGILAILLGTFGIHKFYLGQIGWGIVYLCLSWTGITGLIGLVEGIIYLTTSDDEFHQRYG